ncbi:PH domain-containing protein [Dehalogenimonas sp. THU2]|uniref:PH domain-containing protein n=1 Tax=Dehalogenimonas sp. THU2 TaxID=3151121 RepID=UPI00321886A7
MAAVIGGVAGIGFMLWVWFGAYYEFRNTYLLARMGPFFERIPYVRITSARPFKGMISSMALSSNMIELRHGKNYITGTTYVSPANQEGFLIELKTRCPNLADTSGNDEIRLRQLKGNW